MGGKHLKKLRAERAKVQLKKKKLPKGQNVTGTTFKVKKIVTVEQLKKTDGDEPVSNWNVPFKDLLIRLNHYNFTTRLNGLNGIKELLTNYPDILHGPSLKSLISKLLDLLTDEEHKIRVTAMELLTHVFSLVPTSALLPFPDIITVYLGCAMTHRNASVQQDSLKFIDVMIKYSPEALRDNFWTLTQNFIRIIKKILTEPQGVSKESKQNLEKLKTKVFSRFYLFMVSGLSDFSAANQTSCKHINMLNLDWLSNVSLRQSNSQYKQIPDLSSLFVRSRNKNATLNENKKEEFQSLCDLVIPLMFETWVEFCPEQKFKGEASECLLTEDIAELLCVLLKILMFLYEKAVTLDAQMEHWFTATYSPKFSKCFMINFPYLLTSSRKRSSSGKLSEFASSGCVLQNLIICFLSYSFKLLNRNKDLKVKIENYVSWALTRKSPVEIEILSKTVQAILNTSGNENIFKEIVAAYHESQSSELKQEISKALARAVLEKKENVLQMEESFINWARSLPEQICKTPVLREEIQTLLLLVNRPEWEEIVLEVERKAFDIINNMPNIQVEGLSEFEGQKMVVNILYQCSREKLQEILYKRVLTNSQYSEDLQNYIKDVLFYKLFTHSEFYSY